MTTIMKQTAGLVLASLVALSFAPVAWADETESYRGDIILGYYLESVLALESFHYDSGLYLEFYEEKSDVMLGGQHTNGSGDLMRGEGTQSEGVSAGSSITGDEELTYEVEVEVISTADTSYLKFIGATNEALNDVWIEVPAEYYDMLGEVTGQELLLEVLDDRGMSEEEVENFAEDLGILDMSGLYDVQSTAYGVEDESGNELVVFEFGYNQDRILEYFELIKETYSEERLEESVYAFPHFEEGLQDEDFVQRIVDESLTVIAFYADSMLPAYFYQRDMIPAYGEVEMDMYIVLENELTELNEAEVVVEVPEEFMEFEAFLDLFELDVEGFEELALAM